MILDLRTGAVNDRPFLNIPDDGLAPGGEQGLLGLAFHPDYASNGRFFVYLPALTATSRSWNTAGRRGPHRAVPAAARDPDHRQGHGAATTTAAGWASVRTACSTSTRRRGRGGDPDNNAQNRRELWGKILRIDVDGDDFAGDAPRLRHSRRQPLRRRAPAPTRSGRSACATPGARASTPRRATSTSATSARATARRSTSSPPAPSAAPTRLEGQGGPAGLRRQHRRQPAAGQRRPDRSGGRLPPRRRRWRLLGGRRLRLSWRGRRHVRPLPLRRLHQQPALEPAHRRRPGGRRHQPHRANRAGGRRQFANVASFAEDGLGNLYVVSLGGTVSRLSSARPPATAPTPSRARAATTVCSAAPGATSLGGGTRPRQARRRSAGRRAQRRHRRRPPRRRPRRRPARRRARRRQLSAARVLTAFSSGAAPDRTPSPTSATTATPSSSRLRPRLPGGGAGACAEVGADVIFRFGEGGRADGARRRYRRPRRRLIVEAGASGTAPDRGDQLGPTRARSGRRSRRRSGPAVEQDLVEVPHRRHALRLRPA